MLREQRFSLNSIKDFTCISSPREMLENSFAVELSGIQTDFVHLLFSLLSSNGSCNPQSLIDSTGFLCEFSCLPEHVVKHIMVKSNKKSFGLTVLSF